MQDIKRIRHALGLTQTELALTLDISLSTMCKYEKHGIHSGKVKDRLEVIIKDNKLYHLMDEQDIDINGVLKQLLVSVESMRYNIELMRKEVFG